MPRLVIRTSAQRDLDDIAAYIERQSGSRRTAETFTNKLIDYCLNLASLPGLMGRPRPEFWRDYRTTAFGDYVVVFRYANDDGARSHLYMVHVLHGARDLEAYFKGGSGGEN